MADSSAHVVAEAAIKTDSASITATAVSGTSDTARAAGPFDHNDSVAGRAAYDATTVAWLFHKQFSRARVRTRSFAAAASDATVAARHSSRWLTVVDGSAVSDFVYAEIDELGRMDAFAVPVGGFFYAAANNCAVVAARPLRFFAAAAGS